MTFYSINICHCVCYPFKNICESRSCNSFGRKLIKLLSPLRFCFWVFELCLHPFLHVPGMAIWIFGFVGYGYAFYCINNVRLLQSNNPFLLTLMTNMPCRPLYKCVRWLSLSTNNFWSGNAVEVHCSDIWSVTPIGFEYLGQ